ncbi:hypothetical protein [Micromonospora sp. NPDC049301]|uniref:hypothetical protein n=1 Tax=Micromonospora sp. NPDC049301 TaxID=3155723 RepID=UPI003449E879
MERSARRRWGDDGGQVTEHRYQARRLDVPVDCPFAEFRRRYEEAVPPYDVEYLMGNHSTAERMFRHDPAVMLFAPSRTVITSDDGGGTCFRIEQPSHAFASFGNAHIARVGIELDHQVVALLAHLGVPVTGGPGRQLTQSAAVTGARATPDRNRARSCGPASASSRFSGTPSSREEVRTMSDVLRPLRAPAFTRI